MVSIASAELDPAARDKSCGRPHGTAKQVNTRVRTINLPIFIAPPWSQIGWNRKHSSSQALPSFCAGCRLMWEIVIQGDTRVRSQFGLVMAVQKRACR